MRQVYRSGNNLQRTTYVQQEGQGVVGDMFKSVGKSIVKKIATGATEAATEVAKDLGARLAVRGEQAAKDIVNKGVDIATTTINNKLGSKLQAAKDIANMATIASNQPTQKLDPIIPNPDPDGPRNDQALQEQLVKVGGKWVKVKGSMLANGSGLNPDNFNHDVVREVINQNNLRESKKKKGSGLFPPGGRGLFQPGQRGRGLMTV